ncbi:tryptophan synthase subunit alpha [Oecophyllibacter saccharovorans]|uniref:tryptophan synthase subunit alpha n=1 Tax=Oecophyllibacter saccharovorans TaxID=2558360 RepID=UPI001141D4EA|nr:tryptophan synthase subunit alpha [Oecophyllibacter saccharovorans]QDH14944.1 tryptophan synthase subunit alpha [Oecophyllibacter saccharovorans]
MTSLSHPSAPERKNRIGKRFARLAAEGRGALIPYLEAFDPDRATSLALLKAMPEAGADLIEVGVPFSDPSADGPTIQQAAERGLKAGATLEGVLEMVAEFRQTDDETPVVLMGYCNPIDRFGPEKFCRAAARAGVDGLIVVDLPPEEAALLAPHARANGLDIITLTAPTTPQARLNTILKNATGFVYYVSIAGVTGTASATTAQLRSALERLRQATSLPVAIGFGIRTPQQAAEASRIADGAVVASALIKTLASTLNDGQATPQTLPAVLTQLRQLAAGVRKGTFLE